jgi:hypothetical protein
LALAGHPEIVRFPPMSPSGRHGLDCVTLTHPRIDFAPDQAEAVMTLTCIFKDLQLFSFGSEIAEEESELMKCSLNLPSAATCRRKGRVGKNSVLAGAGVLSITLTRYCFCRLQQRGFFSAGRKETIVT